MFVFVKKKKIAFEFKTVKKARIILFFLFLTVLVYVQFRSKKAKGQSDYIAMVYVAPGTFTMGCTSQQGDCLDWVCCEAAVGTIIPLVAA